MNETITLSRLISRLAATTGTDPNTARRFLRALLNTVRERLEAGESVTITGFGTFAPSADGRNIQFVADAELAAEVNRPFSMFEPVSLAADITEEELAAEDDTPEEVPAEPEAQDETEPQNEQEPQNEPVSEPVVEEPVQPESKSGPVPSFPEDEEPPLHVKPHVHYYHHAERKKKRGRAWLWFAAAATVIGCAGGYFAGTLMEINDYESIQPEANSPVQSVIVEEEIVENDTLVNSEPEVQEVPAVQETRSESTAEPVYEVVDGRNYLSVIANRHYGVRNYWVFIYEANRDILRDPNNIPSGTRVVVPPVESLPGATDEERRQIASRKMAELARSH